MREGAIERMNAASRGGKRSMPSKAARIPKLFRKAISVSLPRNGEMSGRQAKKRIIDAQRRHGGMPATLFYLNREDFPDMAPLNTEAGQHFIEAIIEKIGGVDLIIFDNVQALLSGDMKDELPWQDTLPWVRNLTRRSIGQIWVHHTGHAEDHGYGTKTREWQLDTVALMERVERPEADIAFNLKFTKARERGPDNRSDFEPAVITLIDDAWMSERGKHVRTKRTARGRVFDLLQEAIDRDGVIPPTSTHIPPNTRCVTERMWRDYCDKGCVSEGGPAAQRMAFKRAAKKLVGDEQVGRWNEWCWIIR
jgi:hypothetical protein